MSKLDVVLINPGDRKQIYQSLGSDIAAIEPPFWIGAIAGFLRNNGFTVEIIDSNAENFSPIETTDKLKELDPILTCVIVYGSQPSASTQTMTIAGKICKTIRENTDIILAIGGLHPSALPRQTLNEEAVDFVIEGEGPFTIKPLIETLKSKKKENFKKIPGLWYHDDSGNICSTPKASNVSDLAKELPIAWDLLPMNKYRAHNWHCFDDIDNRMPYGVVFTSLGCPYSCIFCCINAPFGKPGIRFRDPQAVAEEIDLLVQKYNIKNIKIPDELFVLRESHYMKIVDLLLERKYNLNFWVYARVDTVKAENLDKMKRAGINWLALGIESANPEVRDGATKRMKEKDIYKIVKLIQESGIHVIGNYIFGLPDDTIDTMNETLNMAIKLNCEFGNFYSAMAYPGSILYRVAIENNWDMPKEWHAFSQHSYETLPLPTKYISAKEVLKFRDDAFLSYFSNPDYLNMIQDKFGKKVKDHIIDVTKTRLKRKILEV
jgi:anaerobic magnesium-protoporphyrin IX monomethyl ester cyclase